MNETIEPCPNPECGGGCFPEENDGGWAMVCADGCGYMLSEKLSETEITEFHNRIARAVREAQEQRERAEQVDAENQCLQQDLQTTADALGHKDQDLARAEQEASELSHLAGHYLARAEKAEAERDALRADGKALRRMLAIKSGVPHPYMDDGEASGGEFGIDIDFMRDPVVEIEKKLQAIGAAKLALWAAKDVAEHGRANALHESSSARADYWRERAEKAEAERDALQSDLAVHKAMLRFDEKQAELDPARALDAAMLIRRLCRALDKASGMRTAVSRTAMQWLAEKGYKAEALRDTKDAP